MRRKKLFLVMVVFCIVSLATHAALAATAEKQKIVVGHFHSWVLSDAWNQLVAAFNEKYPDIEVELLHALQEEYEAKLKTLIAAGVAPDLFFAGSGPAAELAKLGAVEDLTPYLERAGMKLPSAEYILGGIAPPYLSDGKVYALALEALTRGIYINIEHYQQAGLNTPGITWTWNEFLANAQKLTTPGTRWGFAINATTSFGNLNPVIHSFGGRWWNENRTELGFNTSEFEQGVKFIADLINVYGVTGGNFPNASASMYPNTPSVNYNFNPNRVPDWRFLPYPRGKQAAGAMSTEGMLMMKSSKNKEAAWKFLEWVFSPEGQRAWAIANRVIVHIPTLQEYFAPNAGPAARQSLIQTIVYNNEHRVVDSPLNTAWGPAVRLIEENVRAAFRGEISPRQAIESAWEACVAELNMLKAQTGL